MVEKIKPGDPSPIKANSLIHIESVVQSTTGTNLLNPANRLDTSNLGGRQVKVEGLVKDWDQGDGNPVFSFKRGSTTLANIIGILDRTINDDDDAIFVVRYSPVQDSPNGQIDIKMTMTGRNGVSNVSFYVKNNPDEPTQENCTPSPCPIIGGGNGGGTSSMLQDANLMFFYDITFDDGSSNAKLLETKFPIELSSLDITDATGLGDSSGTKAIKNVELTLLLAFPDEQTLSEFSTTSSNVEFETVLNIGGTKVSLPDKPQQGFGATSSKCIRSNGETTCANTTLPLGKTILSASTIEQKVDQNSNADQVDVTITVSSKGKFFVRDEQSIQFEGDAEGASFTWHVTYFANGITPEGTVSEPEECPEGSTARAVSGGGFTCTDDSTGNDVTPEPEVQIQCDFGFEFLNDICQALTGSEDPEEMEEMDDGEGEITPKEDDPDPEGNTVIGCIVFGVDVCAQAIGGVSFEGGVLEFDDTLIFIVIALLVIGGIVAFATRQSRFSPVPSRF